MHMPVSALLEELFRLHGHRVTLEAPLEGMSGTVYTIPVLAESSDQALIVGGHLDGSPLSAEAVAEFADTVGDVGADLGILFHSGPRDDGASAAGQGKVVLWDRSQVVRLLGEAQLARSLEETPSPLPLSPSLDGEALAPTTLSDIVPPAFQSGEAVDDRQAPGEEDAAFPIPDLAGLLEVPGSSEALEAPTKPRRPTTDDDDLKPFPPIPQQALPELPPPPPLDAQEVEFLPPGHPLNPAITAFPEVPPLPAMSPLPEPEPPAPMPQHGIMASTAPSPAAWLGSLLPAMSPPKADMRAQPPPSAPAPAPAPSTEQAYPYPVPPPAAPAASIPPPTSTERTAAAAPAARVPSSPLPPFPTARHPVLPVRVRVEEAKRRVRDRLFSVRHVEVLLQPVYLYDYECDVLKEGSLTFDTLDGRIQVHASDKTTLDVDPDVTNPQAPSLLSADHPYAVEERVLRVPEERARQLAFQHAMRKHTRMVNVRVADHNNSLYYVEKRKVEPTPDQVRLRPLGVFLRPVWRLHGANGVVDVDATDGREVLCEVRGNRTDAVILD